jgi:hypothetical protein
MCRIKLTQGIDLLALRCLLVVALGGKKRFERMDQRHKKGQVCSAPGNMVLIALSGKDGGESQRHAREDDALGLGWAAWLPWNLECNGMELLVARQPEQAHSGNSTTVGGHIRAGNGQTHCTISLPRSWWVFLDRRTVTGSSSVSAGTS